MTTTVDNLIDVLLFSATTVATTPSAATTTTTTTTSSASTTMLTTARGSTPVTTTPTSISTAATTTRTPTAAPAVESTTTTTTTTAIVTTTVTPEGTTTTAVCYAEDSMRSGPQTDLPLVSVDTDSGSSTEEQPLDKSKGQHWIVKLDSYGDATKRKDAKFRRPWLRMLFSAKGVRLTSFGTGTGSNVGTLDVLCKTTEGKTIFVENLSATQSGRVLMPASIAESPVESAEVTFKSPQDKSDDTYRVSPVAYGCLREETIVALTTTSAGQTVPSTTTTVTTSPTTGAVTTQTVPSTTTTLSSPTTTTSGKPVVGSTTAVTVITTTTTPTVTTTVHCPQSSLMPSQAPEFGKNQLKVVNANDNTETPQPQPDGTIQWTSGVPREEKGEKNPQMFINLPKDALLSAVTIIIIVDTPTKGLPGSITITIIFADGSTETFEKYVPEDGIVTFYPSPEGTPVGAKQIQVSSEGTNNPEAEKIDMTVKVTGCFVPSAGE